MDVELLADCWPGIMAEVAAAVSRQAAVVRRGDDARVHGIAGSLGLQDWQH